MLKRLPFPVLLLCVAAVLFYLPGLLPGRVLLPLDILCGSPPWSGMASCAGRTPANPILSDQVLAFFPWHEIQKRDGWRGTLWNRYGFAGSPLLANGQSAPLYPPNWVHWVLPPSWSYALLAIFRAAVAACFTWAFARRYVSEPAARLAAVSYAFSFTFTFAVGIPNRGDAMAWLPALLWAVDCRRWVFVSVFTALELLAGQPETTFVAAFTIAVWFLSRRPTWKDVACATLAVCGGTLLALPQLLPTVDYILRGAASYFRNQYKPLPASPRSLLELLTPEFFGTSAPARRWGSHEGGFFGLASLLLALGFLGARPRAALRNAWTWVLLASLEFIYQPLPLGWLLELPYVRTIFVIKFWASASFAGAMLAAHGLDEHAGKRIPRLLQFCCLPVAFCLLIAFSLWHYRSFIQALNLGGFETLVVVKFALSLIFVLAVLRWRPAWTAILVFGECALYLVSYNTAAPAQLLYPRPPVVDFLKKDTERFRIMGDGVFPANTAAVYGLEDLRGYDGITPMRWLLLMSQIDPAFPDLLSQLDVATGTIRADTLSQIDNIQRPLAKWGDDFRELLRHGFYWNERLSRVDRPELLDMLNVKYYLVPPGAPLPQGLKGWQRAYSQEVDVYENPRVFPRAYVLRAGNALPEPAQILRYLPNEVVLRAEGPGTLVLADAWDPGWHAEGFVITPYQGFLRSVSLPPGSHTVRFLYSPW